MARSEACRILIWSIFFEETKAIFHDKALSFIRIFNSSLFLADKDFESANSLNDLSSLKITAAATTGPAKGPLPTSSTPATNFKSFLQQPLLQYQGHQL